MEPLTVMGPPPTPTPTSRFVLTDLNSFAPMGTDGCTNQHPAYPPDQFRAAADHQRVLEEEKRAMIGASGTEKKRGRKSKKNQENVGAAGEDSAGKTSFNGDDLLGIARVCVDKEPFLAPHGKKAVVWEEALVELNKQKDFRHPNMSALTLQHKCEALISYKKDPNGKHKKLANVIGEGSAAITIEALLERMETQYDSAKDKSDDAKAAVKKKNDADKEGGEAIRQASLRAMRRKRSPSPDSASDNDDGDATDPEPPAADAADTVTASSSIETLDAAKAKAKPPAKRRRLNERRPASGKDALLDVLKEENKRRAEHDNRVATSLDTFVKDSREQKAEFASILRELITSDRAAREN
ncbi:hypothetical protein C8R47DRAFT_1197713 [Mycena vitilis]|nr:hypothetical protein C8R47DRAFT_1197713 [Mycena vitilis]